MASLNPNADPFLSEGRYLQPEDGDGEDGRRRRVFHGASVVDARRPLDESNDRRRRFFFISKRRSVAADGRPIERRSK